MRYTEYDLAQRIRGKAAPHVVELATVKSLDPLVIKIGNSTYSSEDWLMYECWYEVKDGERKNGVMSDQSSGGIASASISYQVDSYESDKSAIKYNVDDMLAVQQLEGNNVFIILAKVRRVT